MRKTKAQSAIEFVLLLGAVLFFVIVLIGIFQQRVSEKSTEKRNTIITELVLSIQNEISIASKSTDGYTREFKIPDTIAGKNYSIGIYGNYIYLNTTDGKNALAMPTQNVTGQPIKGVNLIRKLNSTIFLN
jgi:NADH:ubiquinone oxidoreductase subunit 6 (subunit J)